MLYDPKWEKQIEARPLEQWRRDLLKAAAIIETRGHCKGALQDGRGRVCALGALNAVRNGDAEDFDTPIAAWSALNAHVRPLTIPQWNNAPERTAEEIVATMRAVARNG